MSQMKQLALDISTAPGPTLSRFFVGPNAALIDHLRHWDEVLRLYQLPKKTELGCLLANSQGGRANVTSVAYLRRASRWLDENTINGNFFLHNALKSAPGLSRRLESMHWSQMLDASI